MYRENLAGYVDLCRIERVPLAHEAQTRLLQACRFALWHQHPDELQSLFMACGMGESEIIERKGFYLRFAAMIGRLVTLVPSLCKFYMLDYIAEDMIDGGDPELVEAGRRLQVCLGHAQNKDQKIQGKVVMHALPDLSAAQILTYQNNPADFIADYIEPGWEFDSDRSYGLAVATELMALDPEDYDTKGPILMNSLGEFSSRESFFYVFTTTTARILNENHYPKWAELVKTIFAPLCGKFQADLGNQAATGSAANDLPEITPELELAAIANVWKADGVDTAIALARKRFEITPGDPFCCGLLGHMHLARHDIPEALACLSRAYSLAPDSVTVVYFLGQAFHAGYFEKQVDLCIARLREMPEYQKNPDQFHFGVELFLKCDTPETHATVDGRPVGLCPLQLRGVKPGHHRIVWLLPDGRQHPLALNLEDATVSKFRYHPSTGEVSHEISRSGSVTLFHNGEPRELSEIVAAYLVDDLEGLPRPSAAECLGTRP